MIECIPVTRRGSPNRYDIYGYEASLKVQKYGHGSSTMKTNPLTILRLLISSSLTTTYLGTLEEFLARGKKKATLVQTRTFPG